MVLEPLAPILFLALSHLRAVGRVEKMAALRVLVVMAVPVAAAAFLVVELLAAVLAILRAHLHRKAIMVEQRLLQRLLTVVAVVAGLVLLVVMVLELLAGLAGMEQRQAFLAQALLMQVAAAAVEITLVRLLLGVVAVVAQVQQT